MTLSAEEKLALSMFAAEKTSEGVLGLDTEGRILFANESASRMLGYSVPQLGAQDIFYIAPEMVPVLWKELWKELRENDRFAFEFQLQAASGASLQVDILTHRLTFGQRELGCLFFHDIEDRKRLQSLHQEFVTNVSHELRTPMTVIREGISQVSEGLRGEINDSQKRALTLALSGIERMGRMIDDLLDMSKIEAGKIALRRERLDLNAIVRDVASAFQAVAEDRRMDLRVTTPAGPVTLYADHDRLVQVLTNLVGNSFKYTEKGHIQIEIASQPHEVLCSVMDTGIGVSKDDLEKMFVKFEQLGQVAFTGEKGTGLGLSISRGIVELHKGRIWAESAGAGKGSRVLFTLPRQSGQDVFLEQLGGLLHDVARRGGSLSTVDFKFSGNGTKENASLSGLLCELENMVRKQTGRMSDLVIRDVDALHVGLQSMVKKEAERIAGQILETARKELARKLQTLGMTLTYAITSFPEDAAQESAYLAKIFTPEDD